jgi:hypothetical protein
MFNWLIIASLYLGLGFGLVQKPANNWRGIVPLVTKRFEVEALLGPHTLGSGYVLSYDTEDERITIWYGGAQSAKDDPCRWNVPADTVIHFLVAQKKRILVSQVPLDWKRFEKQQDREIECDFFYFDKENGITVATRIIEGQEVFESVHYNPTLVERRKCCHPMQ